MRQSDTPYLSISHVIRDLRVRSNGLGNKRIQRYFITIFLKSITFMYFLVLHSGGTYKRSCGRNISSLQIEPTSVTSLHIYYYYFISAYGLIRPNVPHWNNNFRPHVHLNEVFFIRK